MIRSSGSEEADDEAKMQNFMFKLNMFLFVGTVVAIRAGIYLNKKISF